MKFRHTIWQPQLQRFVNKPDPKRKRGLFWWIGFLLAVILFPAFFVWELLVGFYNGVVGHD